MDRTVTAFLTTLLFTSTAHADLPTVAEILTNMGAPASDEQQVLAGEFITRTLDPSNERELAVAIAFFVKRPPADLVEDARRGLFLGVDTNVIATGALDGTVGVDAFSSLKLGADEQKLYSAAKPGETTNLSTGEIAQLAGAGSASGDRVKQILIARYDAYRQSGLAGIAEYARDGGKTSSVAADMRGASELAKGFKTHAPAFYDALLNYPASKPAGFVENFRWMHYLAHGDPTLVLVHGFFLPVGEAFAIARRHYYVSRNYNAEQALIAFLPVPEGTLVAYVGRVWTDQVAGFGGGMKRSIGSNLLQSQLEALYQKSRTLAEQGAH
jgi:hypothetical protein